jgi:hypothetical protein
MYIKFCVYTCIQKKCCPKIFIFLNLFTRNIGNLLLHKKDFLFNVAIISCWLSEHNKLQVLHQTKVTYDYINKRWFSKKWQN